MKSGDAEIRGRDRVTGRDLFVSQIDTMPLSSLHVLLLAAHPDDEVLGAGGQFGSMRRLTLVHLTDGASSQLEAWRRGWVSRQAYSNKRIQESMDAVDLAGVAFEYRSLGAPDRRASFAMAEYTLKLAKILRTSWPDVVLSHAYEGGHADHDAAAFVAHHACRLTGIAPLWEMTGYHAAQGQRNGHAATLSGVPVVSGTFLPPSEPRGNAVRVPLNPTTARLKRRMLDCFESQRKALADLRLDLSYEMFRPAPVYDFSSPPHAGRLLYDTQSWTRVKGDQWRLLAREAAAALELAPRSVPAVNSLQGRVRL